MGSLAWKRIDTGSLDMGEVRRSPWGSRDKGQRLHSRLPLPKPHGRFPE